MEHGAAGVRLAADAPRTFPPACIRARWCPDRELLLVWGEQDGWLIAADTAQTEPPIVVAYLGQDILPRPDTVRRFVTDMVAGRRPRQLQPPGVRSVDDLTSRLAVCQVDGSDQRRRITAKPG